MFGFNFDRRILYIVLALVLVFSFANSGTDNLLGLLLTLPGVIIAITFHEFAHAYTAYKLGDDTPLYQGRLNLNPLSHLDPLGFIMLIVAHFGWGKPVQIDPRNFNGKYTLSACEAIVSVAGPIMNFIIAIIFSIIMFVVTKFADTTFIISTTGSIILSIIQYTVIVNIGLGVFNLIPLPPLDGEKIFRHILPYRVQEWLDNNYQTLYAVFIILWIFGILGVIVSPVINVVMNGLFFVIENLVGIFI